ncbi:hypothetical protein GTA09_02135 [Rhodococcus hoagii]|nr:hypothetical protein [Prescottella equi]NKZ68880.1 hypothetical protein [Prescottella equi]
MMMIGKVFFWCRGQDDNIGDVLLRRRMLRDLRRLGEVHVLIGGASEGFIESMGFTPSEVLYRSSRRWLTELYRVAIFESITLAFNPGEVRVGPKSALAHTMLLPAQALGKFRDSTSVRVGIAIRGSHRLWEIPLRWSDRLADVVIRRNVEALGTPIEYGPDWAFDEGGSLPAVGHGRDRILLTFRSDRPQLPADTIAGLRAVAEREGLELLVFTQVRRDNARGEELARLLGCKYEAWPEDVTHTEQEARVRALMRSARAVVSDRIHALIMGTTEGALPIGLIPSDDSKVGSHFAAAGIHNIAAHCDGMGRGAVQDFVAEILQRSEELGDAFERSRTEVIRMGTRVLAGHDG